MKWIVILTIIIVAAMIACVLWAKQLSKHTFQCKNCSTEFSADWKKLLFAVHSDNCYEIRCPHCSKKGCNAK